MYKGSAENFLNGAGSADSGEWSRVSLELLSLITSGILAHRVCRPTVNRTVVDNDLHQPQPRGSQLTVHIHKHTRSLYTVSIDHVRPAADGNGGTGFLND